MVTCVNGVSLGQGCVNFLSSRKMAPVTWLAFAGPLLSWKCGLMAFHALVLGLWVRVVECVLLANHDVEHDTFGDMINELW